MVDDFQWDEKVWDGVDEEGKKFVAERADSSAVDDTEASEFDILLFLLDQDGGLFFEFHSIDFCQDIFSLDLPVLSKSSHAPDIIGRLID